MKGKNTLNNKNYHYRIIDIKNSKLQLNSDNKTIRNTPFVKSYKTQIYIYNSCLGKIQGYESPEGYILSKALFIERNLNNNKYKHEIFNPFYKPGIIEFLDFDNNYKNVTLNAINWLKDLNMNYNKWKLNPPSNNYLYPNMNNQYDGKYKYVKQQIADDIGEITNLWNCSVENRNLAFKHNIKSWKSKKCNSKLLGIKGKNSIIIDKIINFHKNSKKIINIDKNIPNIKNWQDKNKLSFYVDFETFNGNFTEIIFMIGLGWEFNNNWYYKNYIINNISYEEEKYIFNEFINNIDNISRKYNEINPNIYHWSKAEPILFNKMNKRNNNIFKNINWFDFLDIFKENLILIKNCYNFSLKNIANEMYKNNFIKTIWDDNDISNGLDAMYMGWEIYQNNDNVKNSTVMKNIIKYNEIDCKVVYEIVNYLRNYLNN